MEKRGIQLINGVYSLKHITIIVGNFGSGKTEVAVNFALAVAVACPKEKVAIVDLDVVNPYFRCREAADIMEKQGIAVVYPKGEYAWADLPIILPEIKGLLERKDGKLILDVGGDDIGAKALASLAGWLPKGSFDVLFVLNPNRPFTQDTKGAMKIMKEIEDVSGLSIEGLIVNTHLVDETTPDVIMAGLKIAKDVSKKSNIPIKFAAVMKDLLAKMDGKKIGLPILPLTRCLLPPWKKNTA